MVPRIACLFISSTIVACSSAPAPDPQPNDTTPAYFALAAGHAAPLPTRPAPEPISADLSGGATGEEATAAAATATVVEVTVPELVELLEGGNATAVDANNDSTRRELGVIPGAVRLSSFSSYDASELPADKSTTVIFYCTNPDCQSAPNAALRAAAAGYVDVRVLRAGVTGWITSGHKVDK